MKLFLQKIFFYYPIIEIQKFYHKRNYTELDDEGITTFLYEVNDPYFSLLKSNTALIRFSRPSITTSKISAHSRDNLINLVYHVCLHPMRKRFEKEGIYESKSYLTSEEYTRAREYFENVFYRNQAAVSEIDSERYLLLLTEILGVAAIASIIAIMYVIPYYGGFLSFTEEAKSVVGTILLVLVVILLFSFVKEVIKKTL